MRDSPILTHPYSLVHLTKDQHAYGQKVAWEGHFCRLQYVTLCLLAARSFSDPALRARNPASGLVLMGLRDLMACGLAKVGSARQAISGQAAVGWGPAGQARGQRERE